ncbi:MAG: ComF family protein [Ruminococcaceae bacterium]|nr:ComF family protein [Oscillospiraceae bacterium]
MSVLSRVLDLLYPPKCVFCRKLLSRGEQGWCRACEKKIPYYDEKITGDYFTFCVAPLEYRDDVREAIHRFKFSALDCYAEVFAPLVAESLAYHGVQADLLTWVPVSRTRKRERGYDQAEALCRSLSKLLGLPARPLLTKTVDNKAQSSLDSLQRKANVLGVYSALNTELFAGKRVLLVDDVITTGATLSECSRVLLTAGALQVTCAAIACSTGEKEEK